MMRKKNIWSGEWIKHFALLPENVNGTTVWLEHYWKRYVKIGDDNGCPCGSHIIGKYELTLEQQND
jgi:hypothetical protein